MAAVWYVGWSSVRVITAAEWTKYSAGTQHGAFSYADGTSKWDRFSFGAPYPYWLW